MSDYVVVLSARNLHCGDHISWPIESTSEILTHHAIVVAWKGGDVVKVIHVTPKENDGYEVREDLIDLGAYVKQRKVRHYEYDPCKVYEPFEVVERAKSKLGKFEYSLLANNCEHFARWCKYNKSVSWQAVAAEVATVTAAAVTSSLGIAAGVAIAVLKN